MTSRTATSRSRLQTSSITSDSSSCSCGGVCCFGLITTQCSGPCHTVLLRVVVLSSVMKRLPMDRDAGDTRPQGMTERPSASVMRWLGSLALLAVGIDHIDQYYNGYYRAVPTIGTLFLLNFASALVVGLGLLVPLRRFRRRTTRPLITLLAVSGIVIAGGTLAGLFISESSGLFGFMEVGYRGAIALSIVLDSATVVLLAAFLFLRSRPDGRGKTGDLRRSL